jgi:hypothetical protein
LEGSTQTKFASRIEPNPWKKMRIAPWTMIYVAWAVCAALVGARCLPNLGGLPPFFELISCLFFVVFFAIGSWNRLSRRYERAQDKSGWFLPIWSSSPDRNPQSNALWQVLGFGAFGLSSLAAAILAKRDSDVGLLTLSMSIGLLVGLLLFRYEWRSEGRSQIWNR